MVRQTINRLLVSATFLGMMLTGGNLVAQSAVSASPNAMGQRGAQTHANVQGNPGCQRILAECRNLGFVYGQWKKDNGLYKDCFDPVVRGGTATRDGKPISVPVSASDLQSCRAAAHRR